MQNLFLIILLILAVLLSSVLTILLFFYFNRKHGILETMEESRNLDFLYQNLVKYFKEEKPYLNPSLEVRDVARTILTNRTYLARAIKKNGMVNFNYFVNSFRVGEAMEIFKKDPAARIGETGVQCGFNSTSAFTMAFKVFMNLTPKEWRDRFAAHGALPASKRNTKGKRK